MTRFTIPSSIDLALALGGEFALAAPARGRAEDRAVVETILTHLGLPVAPPPPSPARTPAWLPGVRDRADHERAGGHWAD